MPFVNSRSAVSRAQIYKENRLKSIVSPKKMLNSGVFSLFAPTEGGKALLPPIYRGRYLNLADTGAWSPSGVLPSGRT